MQVFNSGVSTFASPPLRAKLIALLLLGSAPLVRASILDAVQTLRTTGCNVTHPPQSPLHRNQRLDSA
ncbi:MAG: hypothetical protein WCD08_00405, partial [Steroidobacteraceae bacterium]